MADIKAIQLAIVHGYEYKKMRESVLNSEPTAKLPESCALLSACGNRPWVTIIMTK